MGSSLHYSQQFVYHVITSEFRWVGYRGKIQDAHVRSTTARPRYYLAYKTVESTSDVVFIVCHHLFFHFLLLLCPPTTDAADALDSILFNSD